MAPQDDLTAERAAIALLEQMGLYGHPAASQFVGDIIAALKTARQEALRELGGKLEKLEPFMTPSDWGQGIRAAHKYVKDELDRLASEGAPSPIDLLPKFNDDGNHG